MPEITVLMPVYNAEKYLKDAIDSILNQTFKDFELLIINDGSTDKSVEIINSYKDPRINLINNEKNLKLIDTLNKGIKLASGKYIARMDSDDISHPRRLELQLRVMDMDPEIAVCGTGMSIIGKKISRPFLITGTNAIKNFLFVKNCMIHPSVMFRTSILSKEGYLYNKDSLHVEDYELFQKISRKYKIVNLKKALLHYRLSPTGISRIHAEEQENRVAELSFQVLSKIGIEFNRKAYNKLKLDKSEILIAKKELEQAYEKIDKNNQDMCQIVQFIWLDICRRGTGHGIWTIKKLISFKCFSLRDSVVREWIMRIVLKCMFKRA
ncbi:glycosyltransferase family A protein [Bacillus mobilis]|uniref:glycosyltransferase family 2 protein n=1 Tax=Bacillus mobilis TaxID=2026190 RepID=UPI002FDBC4CD